MNQSKLKAAIIDYGMGNIFSVENACKYAGLDTVTTSDRRDLESVDIAILPGVGAFGDAVNIIHGLDLASPIRDFADSGRTLIGICLGMQLLMTESSEFGVQKGLGLIDGIVEHFGRPMKNGMSLKVPHVGWNRIYSSPKQLYEDDNMDLSYPCAWRNTPMESVPEGTYMYFVHSFCVKPEIEELTLSWSFYGDKVFCSALKKKNIYAFQFHPERSGFLGLEMYNKLLAITHS